MGGEVDKLAAFFYDGPDFSASYIRSRDPGLEGSALSSPWGVPHDNLRHKWQRHIGTKRSKHSGIIALII